MPQSSSPALIGNSTLIKSSVLNLSRVVDISGYYHSDNSKYLTQKPNATILRNTDTMQATHTSWLDVKSYTNVVIANEHGSTVSGTVLLLWGQGSNAAQPPSSINSTVAAEHYIINPNDSGTTTIKRFDTRSQWLNIVNITQDVSVHAVFKRKPTEIKIVNDNHVSPDINIGDNSNALYVAISDISGDIIGSTLHGDASVGLYTTLVDSNDLPLATAPGQVLTVAPFGIDSTGVSGATMYNSGLRTTWNNVVLLDGNRLFEAEDVLSIEDTVDLSFTMTMSLSTVSGVSAKYSVNTVSLGSVTASISDILPGYIISNNSNYFYIKRIDSSVITLNNTTGIGSFPPAITTIGKQLLYTSVVEQVAQIAQSNTVDLYVSGAVVSVPIQSNYRSSVGNVIRDFTDPGTLQSTASLQFATVSANFPTGPTQILIVTRQGGAVLPSYQHNHPAAVAAKNIYVLNLDGAVQNLNGTGVVKSVSGYDVSTLVINYPVPEPGGHRSGESLTYAQSTRIGTLMNDLLQGEQYTNHNAMTVAMTDICGHAQASVLSTSHKFGDVALTYALADNCGVTLGTTSQYTDSNNSLTVYLGLRDGPVTSANPLPVQDVLDDTTTYMVETSLGTTVSLQDLVNITNTDGKPFNLHNCNFVNETAATVWVKLYDIYPALSDLEDLDQGYRMLENHLKLNVAVPGESDRHLVFDKAVTFNYGLMTRVTTGHGYNLKGSAYEVGAHQVYLDLTRSQLNNDTNNVKLDPGSVTADASFHYTAFTACASTLTISGWLAGDANTMKYFMYSINGMGTTLKDASFDTYSASGNRLSSNSAVASSYIDNCQNRFPTTAPGHQITRTALDLGATTTEFLRSNFVVKDKTNFWLWHTGLNTTAATDTITGGTFQHDGNRSLVILPTTATDGTLYVGHVNARIPRLEQIDIFNNYTTSANPVTYRFDPSDNVVHKSITTPTAHSYMNAISVSALDFSNGRIAITSSGAITVIDLNVIDLYGANNDILSSGISDELSGYYGTASGGDISFGSAIPVNDRAFLFSTPNAKGNLYFRNGVGYQTTLATVYGPHILGTTDISASYLDTNKSILFTSSFNLVNSYYRTGFYNSTDVSFLTLFFPTDTSLISTAVDFSGASDPVMLEFYSHHV